MTETGDHDGGPEAMTRDSTEHPGNAVGTAAGSGDSADIPGEAVGTADRPGDGVDIADGLGDTAATGPARGGAVNTSGRPGDCAETADRLGGAVAATDTAGGAVDTAGSPGGCVDTAGSPGDCAETADRLGGAVAATDAAGGAVDAAGSPGDCAETADRLGGAVAATDAAGGAVDTARSPGDCLNTAGSPGDSAAAAGADAPVAAVEADAKPGVPATAGGTTGSVSAAHEPADAVGAAAEPAGLGVAPGADAGVIGSGAEAVGRGVAPAPDTDALGSMAEAARRAPRPASDTDTVGTAAEAARSAPGPAPVVDAVSCDRLVYAFGDTNAVDGLDLGVREGEVFGLLGPNGAGKTTAIRCITTLLPVPAGMVGVFGHDAAKERMAVRRLLGYVPQQLSADSGLTGRENVALFARVFDVPRRERAERVSQALAAVGLADAADRLAGTYSGGMVRRLELAQALVSAPRLLILDEPTIGLDPIARTGVWEHINAVRAATGMTVLVTTHYMDEADQYCDRVGLMHRGRIRALGTPAELRRGLAERLGTDTLPTLEDVFRDVAGSGLDDHSGGGFRDVRSTRRTARRVG